LVGRFFFLNPTAKNPPRHNPGGPRFGAPAASPKESFALSTVLSLPFPFPLSRFPFPVSRRSIPDSRSSIRQ
jgi:hypothetical protein